MRTTALFFAYLVACLILAALLTPALMHTGWLDYPPERVMRRLAQVFILLGLWPMLRAFGVLNRESLGFGASRRAFLRSVALGWVLGVLILLVLVLALLLLEVRVGDRDTDTWPFIARTLGQALVAGILIGLLEETLFRGALFAAIRRREGLASAVIWSSLLYALLHVMKPGALPPGMAFDQAGSWTMFVGVFRDALQWRHLDTVLALLAVGVFLALVRERTGHIGWCIGLHAGWVLVIQVSRRLSDGNPDSPFGFLAGDYDGTIGWLSMVWIGLLAAGYWRWSSPARRTEGV